MKKEQKEFDINLYQLDNKLHTFEYKITSDFFSQFTNSLIEKAEGKVILELEKSPTMMQLNFNIGMKVELPCDVSLDPFWHPVNTERGIIIKFGEEEKELSEDVRVIPMGSQKINVAEYIYEFASLGIPMKKVHPKLVEEERPDLIYQSETETPDEEEKIDPRWEALKKLKD